MKYTWLLGVLLALIGLIALVSCAKTPPPDPVLMTPSSRLIYHDQNGHAVWTTCDRGNRLYMSHSGLVQVVSGGCTNGEP